MIVEADSNIFADMLSPSLIEWAYQSMVQILEGHADLDTSKFIVEVLFFFKKCNPKFSEIATVIILSLFDLYKFHFSKVFIHLLIKIFCRIVWILSWKI